jgi:hypothetical protein
MQFHCFLSNSLSTSIKTKGKESSIKYGFALQLILKHTAEVIAEYLSGWTDQFLMRESVYSHLVGLVNWANAW